MDLDSDDDHRIQKKDKWDKFKIISGAIGAIGIPILVVFLGLLINSNVKNQDSKTKLVEIAIEILRGQTKEKDDPLRLWAIEIVDKNSDVKMGDKVKLALSSRAIIEETTMYYEKLATCPSTRVSIYFESYQEPSYNNSAVDLLNQHDVHFGNLAPEVIAKNGRCFFIAPNLVKDTYDRIKEKIDKFHQGVELNQLSVDDPEFGLYEFVKSCAGYEFYMHVVPYSDYRVEDRLLAGSESCTIFVFGV